MSKLFKCITACLLAVALIQVAIPASANPQVFGPDSGSPSDRTTGSITVTRVIGEEIDEVPEDGFEYTIPRVPIRITLVEFYPASAEPTEANLRNPAWIAAYTRPVGYPNPADFEIHEGFTNADGYITFPNLPLGIWLVQELDHLDGQSNPVIDSEARFSDFLVGVPRYTGLPRRPDPAIPGEYLPAVQGEWEFDIRVYPKSQIPVPPGPPGHPEPPGYPETEVNEKNLVGTLGNIATWEIRYSIPHQIGTLDYFMVRDTHSAGLRFIPGTVVGRFTPRGATNNRWEAGEALENGVDFTVVYNTTTRRTDIELTQVGRNRLASEGLLGDGTVMFRLQSVIVEAGIGRNIAVWHYPSDCPPEHPDYPECDTICPIDDPNCQDKYDFCLIYPNHPDCQNIAGDSVRTFYLELIKRSTATGGQRLPGAVFHMYRELTAYEAANLTDAAFTALGGRRATYQSRVARVIPLLNADGNQIRGTTNANGVTNFGRTPLTSEGVPYTTAEHPSLWLFEYQAPSRYRYVSPWVPVHVTRRYLRPGSDIYVDVVVYNHPIRLPQTGAIAIGTVVIGGIALASGLAVAKKKKKD